MKPGLPAIPEPDDAPGDGPQYVEVGEFRQGSQLSQWALSRYLVGRAVVESLGRALLMIVLLLLALAALAWFGAGAKGVAVLLIIIAVGVLLMRWVLLAIVGRLTGFAGSGPFEQRMKSLVDDTSADVLRELRRIGLPGRVWTLPLLAARLITRRRRAQTVAVLRQFELERAVPKRRLDELHLVLRGALGDQSGGVGPPPA